MVRFRLVIIVPWVVPLGCLLAATPPQFTDEPPPAAGWIDVAVGGRGVCGLQESGILWCGEVDDLRRIYDQRFIAVSNHGQNDACGVRDDGTLACGIAGGFGLAEPFELGGPFVDVSGSVDGGCGLRDDGSVECWPDAADTPGTFTAIAASGSAGCGIRKTGAVSCFAIDSLFAEPLAEVPSGDYEQVATGDNVACAVASDASVDCWGEDVTDLVSGPPDASYVHVSVSFATGCAARRSGAVECWGESQSRLQAPDGIDFAVVEVDRDRACGIAEDSTLHCWGG